MACGEVLVLLDFVCIISRGSIAPQSRNRKWDIVNLDKSPANFLYISMGLFSSDHNVGEDTDGAYNSKQ